MRILAYHLQGLLENLDDTECALSVLGKPVYTVRVKSRRLFLISFFFSFVSFLRCFSTGATTSGSGVEYTSHILGLVLVRVLASGASSSQVKLGVIYTGQKKQ